MAVVADGEYLLLVLQDYKFTRLVYTWKEVTIVWNKVTIWWNEVTKGWNEVVWNEVVMERSNRIPTQDPGW